MEAMHTPHPIHHLIIIMYHQACESMSGMLLLEAREWTHVWCDTSHITHAVDVM